MEDPANFAFLVLYMPMFPTPPAARESQARSVCSEVGAPFQCPVALAIPGPVGARVFGEDLQVGEQEGNKEGDRGLYFLCTRFRIMSDYYLPMADFQDWAGVETNLHRALASYVRRRANQNEGVRRDSGLI